METARQKLVNRAPSAQPAAAVVRRQIASPAVQLQAALKVSSPHDPAEREAETTAKRVMRMATPAHGQDTFPAGSGSQASGVLRATAIARRGSSAITAQRRDHELIIQRQADRPAGVPTLVGSEIQNSSSSGAPLPRSVRGFMEPRFNANFSQVRIHTGEPAARLNRQLSAQAFTVGNQVYFGKDRFRPETHEGKELIAHELTHTIQQGAVVQRSAEVTVAQSEPIKVQRLGLSDALNFFAAKANLIPGFRMFTIVLGVNPINMTRVERSAANVTRAVIELIPGGGLISQALDNHGVFDKVGAWVEQQIRSLGMVGGTIKKAIADFLDTLSWSDVFDLGGVWERAKRIFTEPIDRIINFAKGLVSGVLQFIKEAILRPLGKLAEGTRGYDLLKAVLGFDPVTNDPVPRTADTLMGGFMKLIGEEEVWHNLKKSNAVPRAWAWFQGALAAVLGFVREIPTLFVSAFKSLEIADIILLPRAFLKIAAVFGSFVGKFISWAGSAVWNLLEIIFDVVSPGALGYIKKTGSALRSILKNPLPFVGNLVKAAKLGFENFATNFGTHLKAGLIDWLTGSLPGIYIPQSFSLQEIVKFALSVLGLSWQNLRQKLVKIVGEDAVKAMETGFDIVVTLVRDGPAAGWDKIKDQLANLKDMVIGGITDFVIDMVVKKAVPKLIAMFIPGAGFISAILSIYDTIMVFVNKIKQIIQVVTGFIDSIVAIASGAIGAAAKRVETTLAGLLSLAINFLAGFLGLGKVADKVMAVIQKIRAPIDKALDWLINWIVTMAKKLGKFVATKAGEVFTWAFAKTNFSEADGKSHSIYVEGDEPPRLMIASDPKAAEAFLEWYIGEKGKPFADKREKLITNIRVQIKAAKGVAVEIAKLKKSGAAWKEKQGELLNKNVVLSGLLSTLVGDDPDVGKTVGKYKLEGMTGTYGSIPKPPGDDFTADHQPQAAVLTAAAKFRYFSKTGELAERAEGRAKEGYAINLYKARHIAGATYGSKGKETKESFLARVKPLVKDKPADQQRREVIGLIKQELRRDVAAIKNVVRPQYDAPIWADVTEKAGKDKEGQKLVGEIRSRIIAGEDQIANQDLDSLAN